MNTCSKRLTYDWTSRPKYILFINLLYGAYSPFCEIFKCSVYRTFQIKFGERDIKTNNIIKINVVPHKSGFKILYRITINKLKIANFLNSCSFKLCFLSNFNLFFYITCL